MRLRLDVQLVVHNAGSLTWEQSSPAPTEPNTATPTRASSEKSILRRFALSWAISSVKEKRSDAKHGYHPAFFKKQLRSGGEGGAGGGKTKKKKKKKKKRKSEKRKRKKQRKKKRRKQASIKLI
eukprot:Skav221394  [mRNA]  locus=scaffold1029:220732:221103:- [translate_table: standard]